MWPAHKVLQSATVTVCLKAPAVNSRQPGLLLVSRLHKFLRVHKAPAAPHHDARRSLQINLILSLVVIKILVQNGGMEASMEWVLAHMGDPDFNDPLPDPSAAPGGSDSSHAAADSEAVMLLASMGFTEAQVRIILESP